jgi:hypothetical protein
MTSGSWTAQNAVLSRSQVRSTVPATSGCGLTPTGPGVQSPGAVVVPELISVSIFLVGRQLAVHCLRSKVKVVSFTVPYALYVLSRIFLNR